MSQNKKSASTGAIFKYRNIGAIYDTNIGAIFKTNTGIIFKKQYWCNIV